MSFRSILIASTVLVAWSASAAAEAIKIGVTAGPHAQILEAVKPIAAKKGLDIQLIEFSDYVVPNAARARRCRCRGYQHQLCDPGRIGSRQRSYPSRRSERAIRQSHCGPYGRQGQGVGQDAGGKLPDARGEGICAGQVQGRGTAELV